jgi:hypothetical protein
MDEVFVRIDDRLLHGQVVVSWIPYLKANLVVVADDEYAKDEFMRSLISFRVTSEHLQIIVFSSILNLHPDISYLIQKFPVNFNRNHRRPVKRLWVCNF